MIADLIWLFHMVFMIITVSIPFTSNKLYRELFIGLFPFILWHWITNDDNCVLTQIEMKCRECEKNESFFYKLISPIYVIENNTIGIIIKSIYILLFYIVLYKNGYITNLINALKEVKQSKVEIQKDV